jgi:hypothetical protein
MKVLLVDTKSFASRKSDEIIVESKDKRKYGMITNSPVVSINMNKYTDIIFSNGYCPVKRIVKRNDNYIGIISNEYVPCGYYEGYKVDIQLLDKK